MWWGLMVCWFVGWVSLGEHLDGTLGGLLISAEGWANLAYATLLEICRGVEGLKHVEAIIFVLRNKENPPPKKTRIGGKSPYEDTMSRIQFVERAIKSTQFESQSKIQMHKINPKICRNTTYIEFVGPWFLFFCVQSHGLEAKKVSKQTSLDVLHQDQGVVQPPKRQKLETNGSSEATGCKRWQLVGGRACSCSQKKAWGGLEFCKGIDVKLSFPWCFQHGGAAI